MITESNFSPKALFQYTPGQSFGTAHLPFVLSCDIKHDQTAANKVTISDLKPLSLSPFCSALHYGQSIFEGLKAYRQNSEQTGIFRPELHAERFEKSADRMSMPKINPDFFMNCLIDYVKACKKFIPNHEGVSLYLRPLLFANDPVIKLRSSQNYKFMIMSTIVEQYFKPNQPGGKVLVNKNLVRAFPGGTGEAKTSANYAVSLQGLEYAIQNNFDQVLYVDASTKTKIEELGGMNFFMVKDNSVITPKLDGQILRGVTRRSVIEICESLNIRVYEKDILLTKLTDGSTKEVFACGTAASIANLSQIGVQESHEQEITRFDFPKKELSTQLRKLLVDTHFGKTDFSKKWLHIV